MRIVHGRPILAAVALVAMAGCSSGRYVYQPEENATAIVSGHMAAAYPLPPLSPHGMARVAVLGITSLQAQDPSGYRYPIRALHLRMVVDNGNDNAPWHLDTRQQILALDHHGESRPAFASSSVGRPPELTIAPGETDTIDLYYPLPADLQKASLIPHVSLRWNIETPQGAMSEPASFERVHVEPAPSYYADLDWGPGWYGPWYDPFWPEYAFWGAPVFTPVTYVVTPPAAVRVR